MIQRWESIHLWCLLPSRGDKTYTQLWCKIESDRYLKPTQKCNGERSYAEITSGWWAWEYVRESFRGKYYLILEKYVEMGQEVHSWQKEICEQRHERGKERTNSRIRNLKDEAWWMERSKKQFTSLQYWSCLVMTICSKYSVSVILSFYCCRWQNIYLPTHTGYWEYKISLCV